MNTDETTRLIIITVAQPEVAKQIQNLRSPLCHRYSAPWALRYPPHITLRTGLIVPNNKLDEVFQTFTHIVDATQPFTIQTQTTAYSQMKYEDEEHFFIYQPVQETPALMSLNQQLLTYRDYRKSDKMTFYPHLTLFWGDIPKNEEAMLRIAIDCKKNGFSKTFSWQCNTFAFYQEKEDGWHCAKTIYLSSSVTPANNQEKSHPILDGE